MQPDFSWGRSVGCLCGWSVGWFGLWIADLLAGWLVGSLAGQLACQQYYTKKIVSRAKTTTILIYY